MKATTKLRIQ